MLNAEALLAVTRSRHLSMSGRTFLGAAVSAVRCSVGAQRFLFASVEKKSVERMRE